MLGNARHRMGVEHLKEERRDSSYEHRREVGVDEAGDTVDRKIRGIRVDTSWRRVLREAHGATNVGVGSSAKLRRYVFPVEHAHCSILSFATRLWFRPFAYDSDLRHWRGDFSETTS